ncbi:UDP-N-acetylglucosamine 2-epimerase [Luminiphilus sp.]|nr:UDP-N-acetylglucosamine 2-epimerase [Luminiphilus sp.]
MTGTRAEYGLLKWVLSGINESPLLNLQLIITGMHLSPEFGMTVEEIEKDGFFINRRIEMLLSADTPSGVSKSMGLGLIGFADAVAELRPDIVLILGDRFEILAAAISAMVARIPIAHLHGGEATEGLIDEAIRHSITKMSHLHFVAAHAYRRRVIQLGEDPECVFNVGGLGIDSIKNMTLLPREVLEDELNLKFSTRNLLVTFHPVTLDQSSSEEQMLELLAALRHLVDTTLIFTMPNSDTDGRVLMAAIENFVLESDNAHAFTSLGQLKYLSCMAQVDAVVGNSSSGLIEAPSFKTATVNIGDRQRGRLKCGSVIDCLPVEREVAAAVEQVYLPDFQRGLKEVVNPYGEGGASKAIIDVLETVDLDGILKKPFNDMVSM